MFGIYVGYLNIFPLMFINDFYNIKSWTYFCGGEVGEIIKDKGDNTFIQVRNIITIHLNTDLKSSPRTHHKSTHYVRKLSKLLRN